MAIFPFQFPHCALPILIHTTVNRTFFVIVMCSSCSKAAENNDFILSRTPSVSAIIEFNQGCLDREIQSKAWHTCINYRDQSYRETCCFVSTRMVDVTSVISGDIHFVSIILTLSRSKCETRFQTKENFIIGDICIQCCQLNIKGA